MREVMWKIFFCCGGVMVIVSFRSGEGFIDGMSNLVVGILIGMMSVVIIESGCLMGLC